MKQDFDTQNRSLSPLKERKEINLNKLLLCAEIVFQSKTNIR